MQMHKLLAALVVLGLLGLLVWKLEAQPPPVEEQDAATRFHPNMRASDIRSIRIGEEDKAVLLERQLITGDAAPPLEHIGIGTATAAGRSVWLSSTSPPRLASSDLSEAVAEALVDMAWFSQIEAPPDLGPFGLGSGATQVQFETNDGQSHLVRLGAESPLGGKRYVLLTSPPGAAGDPGSPKVSLVDSWSLGTLDRDPLSFREPRIFPFDVARITHLRIERPDAMALDLRREGRVWRFAESNGLRAETHWVKEVLRSLAGLEAVSFQEVGAEFASPIWLQITDEEGKTARLEAAPEAEGRIYQIRSTGSLLPATVAGIEARVEAKVIDRLLVPNESVHALELLDFNPGTSSRVEWQCSGSLWTLRRTGRRWTLQAGTAAAEERVPAAGVEAFLESVDALKAQSYSAEDLTEIEAGTETARITIEQEDGHRVGLRLFADGLQDRVALDEEPGLRDVSGEVSELLATHRRFAEQPPAEEESP